MVEKKRQNERLIVLLLLGGLAINYPLLALFSKSVFWLGIPLLYFYLFTGWALFIGGLAMILRKRNKSKLRTRNS